MPAPAPPLAAPVEVDPLEARRAAQRRAAQSAAAQSGAAPAEALDARREAQRRARASTGTEAPARPAVRPPSDFPLARFGLRMVGATQSWDGLRIQWESEGKPAEAYEVVVSDHPLSPEETGELLSGSDVAGARVAAVPSEVRVLIDNVTPREARGYFAVIARDVDGTRQPIGCLAQGWDECRVSDAPFFAPDSTEEARDLANGMVREAKMQLMLFTEDEDVGAWREALRIVGDALVVFPGFPPALQLKREIQAARQV